MALAGIARSDVVGGEADPGLPAGFDPGPHALDVAQLLPFGQLHHQPIGCESVPCQDGDQGTADECGCLDGGRGEVDAQECAPRQVPGTRHDGLDGGQIEGTQRAARLGRGEERHGISEGRWRDRPDEAFDANDTAAGQ